MDVYGCGPPSAWTTQRCEPLRAMMNMESAPVSRAHFATRSIAVVTSACSLPTSRIMTASPSPWCTVRKRRPRPPSLR